MMHLLLLASVFCDIGRWTPINPSPLLCAPPAPQLHELLGRFVDKGGTVGPAAERAGSIPGGTGRQAQPGAGRGTQAGGGGTAKIGGDVEVGAGGAAGTGAPPTDGNTAGAAAAGDDDGTGQMAVKGRGGSKVAAPAGQNGLNEE